MRSYTDLHAWQNGLILVKEIYVLTSRLPREEQYGLTSQLRRASTSILANMAEGFGRFSYADKAHKYVIARGECTEVEAFLHMAIAIGFFKDEECHKAMTLVDSVGKSLSGLIKSSRSRRITPSNPFP